MTEDNNLEGKIKSEGKHTVDNSNFIKDKEDISDVFDTTKDRASELANNAKIVLENIKDNATEFINDDAKKILDNAKEKLSEFADDASEKINEFADLTENKLEDLTEDAKETYIETKEKTKGLFQRLFGEK